MPSIVGKGARHLAWLCAVLLLLTGCHYSEEDAWENCCLLFIVKDGSAIPEGPKTIIAWQQQTWFRGIGAATDFRADARFPESWKKQQIQAELASFRAGNPEKPAAAYFLDLGMSCMTRAVSSKDAATRCEIELSIRIRCSPIISLSPWPTVPKELRQPMLAHLRMSIDVSAEAVLDVSTRIDPVPGGHLCHR